MLGEVGEEPPFVKMPQPASFRGLDFRIIPTGNAQEDIVYPPQDRFIVGPLNDNCERI
jgi:hypothetical protein